MLTVGGGSLSGVQFMSWIRWGEGCWLMLRSWDQCLAAMVLGVGNDGAHGVDGAGQVTIA